MEVEIVNKAYIPIYILEKETECEPWHQLYATENAYGHVEARWVMNEDGEVVCGDTLSGLLDEDIHDALCIRRPLVIEKFIEDPTVLQYLAEKIFWEL